MQAIPLWMTDAALCSRFSAGSPEVSLTALAELQSFLRGLHSSVKSNQTESVAPSTERLDETAEANSQANELSV